MATMTNKLPEHEKVKYLLADILPNCGECTHFKRTQSYREHYDNMCKEQDEFVGFFTEACDKFKPSLTEVIR